ncbi:thioredoxin-like protein [Globomyces pollinis-pini]|nr:thioredoxin-like protein [Globomyces pollinis-pini]
MPELIHITSPEQFDDILTNSPLLILDFFTDWCPPCKAIAPIYENLSTIPNYSNIQFCKVNAEEVKLNIDVVVWGYPTFVLFHNGVAVEKVTGAKIVQVEELLEKYSKGYLKEDEGYLSFYWRKFGM